MKLCRQFSTIRYFSVEFSDLLWSFTAFYCHKWNTIRSNCIKLQIHLILSNFVISILHFSVDFELLSNSFKIQWFQTHEPKYWNNIRSKIVNEFN
jgi:hypothetical protein